MAEIDELDKKLINLLEQDAWQRSAVLAKILNMSEATVRRRLRRLIQRGVVRAVAITDSDTIPLPFYALIALNIAYNDIDDTAMALRSLPEIVWFATVTGEFDVIILARFPSVEALSQFVRIKLTTMKGVKDCVTSVCVHVHKGRHLLSID